MALSTSLRAWLNACLEPFNIRVETRTAERAELRRLAGLKARGHFEDPAFPILPQFRDFDPQPLLRAVAQFEDRFSAFSGAADGGFTFANDYFSSPDAEIAYAMARLVRPNRIVEIGSGNSTLLFRAAIRDGGLATELVSIDPLPRRGIEGVADRIIRGVAEEVPDLEFESLAANDILFIDSSHAVRAGNDVAVLALKVIPKLGNGVVVHIHDIRLPYEYPEAWVRDYKWNEQYLVQAMLQAGAWCEVMWPGYYLQRTMGGFTEHFPNWAGRAAGSLWLRISRPDKRATGGSVVGEEGPPGA